jgi:hypothetical protein
MAYNFTAASSQYLSVADTAALDITGALTLAAWVKSIGSYAAGGRGIVAKYETGTGQRSYAMAINASGYLQALIASSNSPVIVRAETGQTALGTNWRHCCITFAPNTNPKVFLDGTQETTTNNGTAALASIFSGSAPLWIGAISNNSFVWDGLIAEAAVYSAALTADEIASLAKGMTCDKVRPQSLVFYAPLVRELQDVKGGLTITNNNTATVANHPRVYA